MSLPFHSPREPSQTFAFSSFGVFYLSPHSSGALLFSEDARVIVASLFSSFFQIFFSYFSSLLVISAVTSSS